MTSLHPGKSAAASSTESTSLPSLFIDSLCNKSPRTYGQLSGQKRQTDTRNVPLSFHLRGAEKKQCARLQQ